MNRISAVLGIAGCVLLASCDLVETTPCSDELRFGLLVTVVSAADGSPVIEGLEVVARDDPYFEVLSGFDNQRQGAPERAGTYSVTATAPGFVNQSATGVEVVKGRCHVTPAEVTIRMVPVAA